MPPQAENSSVRPARMHTTRLAQPNRTKNLFMFFAMSRYDALWQTKYLFTIWKRRSALLCVDDLRFSRDLSYDLPTPNVLMLPGCWLIRKSTFERCSSSLMAAFFRRMHFRISFTVLVLCRTRCVDERCVNDTASVHDQTGLVKSVPNIVRQGFAKRILLQKATEVQQCRCVRYLLLEEIAP